MNTANLQLQGLYIVVASLSSALVRKGLLSREELDSTLRAAEDSALTFRTKELSPSNREAVAFPARLLRMANNGEGDGELQGFSELAKMVGELNDDRPLDPVPVRAGTEDEAFTLARMAIVGG